MIAVDTNILIYAHRSDLPQHALARGALEGLVASRREWAIPWPVAHEFVAIVTGRTFGDQRTPRDVALTAINAWLGHPSCRPLGEVAEHWSILAGLIQRARIDGGAVHDARIAAICIGHDIEELWTLDRDFARFPDLRTRNPLIPSLREPAPPPYMSAVSPVTTKRRRAKRAR
jgi:uncharacterized protein